MSEAVYTDDAKVMAKGQITIPRKIRSLLGLGNGDRVTFIVEGKTVKMMNSTVYALQRFQEQMKGEAESAGLFSEEDIDNWITLSRREEAVNESHH